jgi:hypothetical protein
MGALEDREVFYDPAQATEALVGRRDARYHPPPTPNATWVKIAISQRDHVGEYLRAIACPTLWFGGGRITSLRPRWRSNFTR